MNSVQLSIVLLSVVMVSANQTCSDNRPMIGVLMQECTGVCDGHLFIAANYIKYLESAGARVVSS